MVTAIKTKNSHPLSASVRLAIFAFALSSWVEGYSQLRQPASAASILDPHLPFTLTLEDNEEEEDGEESSSFSRWLHRRGRRMDDAERAIMGILDVSVSHLELLVRILH